MRVSDHYIMLICFFGFVLIRACGNFLYHDIVWNSATISWYCCGIWWSIRLLCPVLFVVWVGPETTTSFSPFLRFHSGCSLVMARHGRSAHCSVSSYTAQHFVHMCNWSLSESRYCNTTMSLCCEVRDDIVGHDHTIRALVLIASCHFNLWWFASFQFYSAFALFPAAKYNLANIRQYKCSTVAQNVIKIILYH